MSSLKDVGDSIGILLDAIRALLPDNTRITLLMRHPSNDKATWSITSEVPEEDVEVVCQAIRVSFARACLEKLRSTEIGTALEQANTRKMN